jgi:hypothetical protein
MLRSSPLAAAVLCAATVHALEPDRSRVRVRGGEDAFAVMAALVGAQARLREPSCQTLLDEFRDAQGRPLRERLARFDLAPDDYVAQLFVQDGGERRSGARCRERDVAAVTTPGDKVVYVCAAFRALSPGRREAVLIHELLHTLGLAENPPGPREVNAAVHRRCGS